jgi:hypothetical protein
MVALVCGALGIVLAFATHLAIVVSSFRSDFRRGLASMVPPVAWGWALVRPARRWHRWAAVFGAFGLLVVFAAIAILRELMHALALAGVGPTP